MFLSKDKRLSQQKHVEQMLSYPLDICLTNHTNFRSHIYCVLYVFIHIAALFVKYPVYWQWYIPLIHPGQLHCSSWLKSIQLFAAIKKITINLYVHLLCSLKNFGGAYSRRLVRPSVRQSVRQSVRPYDPFVSDP